MALADLLWACPVCGRDRGLRGAEADGCAGCATRFDRVRGARIRARLEGGEERVRTAAEWVDDLPDPASLLGRGEPIREARVRARLVERYETIRAGDRYVNRIEIFGEEVGGRLSLGAERLVYAPEASPAGITEAEAREPLAWDFRRLGAVQASSRTLQIRGAPHPLASFAFADDSSFLWEQLVALALTAFYRRTGRGEVVELQPRIHTR